MASGGSGLDWPRRATSWRIFPEGYDSLIGEHGCNLSGGQRQRLAIARALLLDPRILLLDDATAAVDSETEHEIQQAIATAQRGRTTILVSNRVSALKRTDRIYVLYEGQIVRIEQPHGIDATGWRIWLDLAKSSSLNPAVNVVQELAG